MSLHILPAQFLLPPTSKKLRGHIGLVVSVHPSLFLSVRNTLSSLVYLTGAVNPFEILYDLIVEFFEIFSVIFPVSKCYRSNKFS